MATSPLVMEASDFIYAEPVARIRKAIELLREKSHIFNHLSFVNASEFMLSDKIASELTLISKRVSSYGTWKECGMKLAEDPSHVTSIAKEMFDSAVSLSDFNPIDKSTDSRDFLKLDLIDDEICNKIASLWFTIHCTSSFKQDIPIRVYSKQLARAVNNLVIVLNAALKVFDFDWKIEEFPIFNLKVPYITENVFEFEWHDQAVSFSEEELEYMRKQEEARKEALRKEEETKKMKENTREMSTDILNSYTKVLDAGSIGNFHLRQDHIDLIQDPKSVEDCVSVRSLWRFLMAMSDSIRYMPGDNGKPLDRITGSFVEINDNIIRYKSNMLLYLYTSFGLTHDDVVTALKFLNGSGEQVISAQYVDTKDYIEEYGKGTNVPKTISVFVSK